MQKPDDHSRSVCHKPSALWLCFTMLIAAGALSVSGYLSYISLTTGQSPAGCGSGSGCAQVLASKWSRLMGVPVSVLAAGVYVCALLALSAAGSGNLKIRNASRFVLTASAVSIIGSSAWFIAIQFYELNAVCPYCMAGHGLGLVLSGLLYWQIRLSHPVACALGLAGVGLLVMLQINTPNIVTTLDAPVSVQDVDATTAGQRTVKMLNGELVLTLNSEPLLGSPDAPRVLVVMFDYACPHCRNTHSVLQGVRDAYPGQLVIVALPTPLNRSCNPHAPAETSARFKESCELAEIAMAVFLADSGAFEGFDRWLFAPPTPRTASQARDEAVRRIGRDEYEQSYADPRTKHMIARNVRAYGQSGAGRVPVLITPGAAAVVGRVDDPSTITDLLEMTASGNPR